MRGVSDGLDFLFHFREGRDGRDVFRIKMKPLLQVLLLLLAVSYGYGAIRCFSCSSTTQTACGDDFGMTSPDAQDCPGTCIKRRGKRDNAGVDTVEVTRGCVQQTGDKCYDSSYNGISVYSCTCNTNYCNSASYWKFSPLATLTVTLSVLRQVFLS